MQKILISIPDSLAERVRYSIPTGKRSAVIVRLIEQEVDAREHQLSECALAVEQDQALHEELADWEITIADGLTEETSK
jgi:metal-responsive CopG/Arc/MetJ family transcriptional regulator